MKKIWLLFFVVFFTFSCKNNENNLNLKQNSKHSENLKPSLKIQLQVNLEKNKIKPSEKIKIFFKSSEKFDSILIFLEDSLISKILYKDSVFYFKPNNNLIGLKTLIFRVFKNNEHKDFKQKILLLSDQKPKWFTYKVINSYPHDPNAYTQGLVYENGILYESTGLETKSSIRKVDLKTGEILYSYENPSNVFGEGLTLFDNKLYQITWQNHTAYVYDKNSFQILQQFTYQTEGWGLTTDGQYLYMSDGSNIIYVREPYNFTVVRKIYVVDDKNPVNLLNELEFIEGKIWANIYTKDYIAIINPKSGKVEAYIDLSNILPISERNQNTDVLNGIAYDKENKRIFVTGKNWPKLFEIKIIEK